ncbi:outer membrane lipoprotein-sorting protein [Desulfatibacillum aliphaticivorans]|uniref:outer membrane lipoprotein-sorting protein n=1 Tax=Desulfatibacillum aliphaticivorans TaxID=218208 RepID=UPI000404B913|nr:outer membrane lipoprotein-sorting protein [Desulfatibacillum aliphaticivorans]
MKRQATGILVLLSLILAPFPALADEDGAAIVNKAFEYMRGETSKSVVEMTIQRPDFTRTMVIKGWTKGKSDALFFIESPPKDAGNGTLKKGRDMWTYNPKVNRTIKLPPSMMSQAWMGSDFSNDDLSKTDSLVEDYDHTVTAEKEVDGMKVYELTSIPHEEAAVVWGKLELTIREDGVLLREAFFDEDGLLVKEMTNSEVAELGGRLFPKVWTMKKAGETDRFTQLTYKELAFDVKLPPNLFSLSSLKTKRR